MKSPVKILFYVDHDNGRDVEILLPLASFAKLVLEAEVEFGFHYDTHKIYRFKPQIVVTPNSIGSYEYYFITSFAKKQNIPVFCLDSEGNFRTDGSFDYWGYNLERSFTQEYVCCWSERTRNYLIEKEPYYKDRIKCTGGLGFDRYKINQFLSKKEYLTSLGLEKKFNKVITYAAWSFGKLYFNKGREALTAYFKGDIEKLNTVNPQRESIRDLLKETIENNSDILFILKVHPTERRPTETGELKNEVLELEHFPNVIIESQRTDIDDLISLSDLWLSFESTTAIEAWLSNKESILLRTNPDFTKTLEDKGLHNSQCVASNYDELQTLINEFYESGTITEFHSNEMMKNRQAVFHKSIGFSDGKNHIRAGYLLKKTIENADFSSIKYRLRIKSLIIFVLIKLGIVFYNRKIYSKLPKAKKFLWVFEQYNLKKVKEKFTLNLHLFNDFYRKHNIKTLILDRNIKLEDIK